MRRYQPGTPKWLVNARFRTNPSLERRGLHTIRSAGERGVALADLLDFLRKGSRLPSAVRRAYDDELNRAVARLVLDDVLRISMRDGFVGGVRAHGAVFARGRLPQASKSANALSIRVLRDAARLPSFGHDRLTLELYLAHRRPVTPADRLRMPTAARTLEVLMAGMAAQAVEALANEWHRDPLPTDPDDWMHWSSQTSPPARSRNGTSYKLYISPTVDQLPTAFQRALPVFSARGVSAFKVGGTAYALCRSDCFVAYLGSRQALDTTARSLRVALRGIPGHGVPFTAPLDATGLLSWGVDFEEEVRRSGSRKQTSWRYWLCERLARFMSAAAREEQQLPPWVFALDRLSLDGIEIPGFVPTDTFVRDAGFRDSRRVTA